MPRPSEVKEDGWNLSSSRFDHNSITFGHLRVIATMVCGGSSIERKFRTLKLTCASRVKILGMTFTSDVRYFVIYICSSSFETIFLFHAIIRTARSSPFTEILALLILTLFTRTMPSNRTIHKWTAKDREYLVLLKLKYARKCVAPVFNQLLARTLAREGLTGGISAPALDAQFQEMKVGGKGHEIYAEIAALSEVRMDIDNRRQIREIEAAARAIPLTLVRAKNAVRRRTIHRISRVKKVRRIRNRAIQRSASRTSSPVVATEEHILPVRQQSFANMISPYFAATATNGFTNDLNITASSDSIGDDVQIITPRLRIRTDSNGNKAPQRPLLLFRSEENPTVFRARKFRDLSILVPKPDVFGSKAYRDRALTHLERCDLYPSPFMSFAQNPHNAIRRIELARSQNFDNKRFLAIFAFNDVEADARQNFGSGAGPHPASMLFKGETSTLPDGYTGGGEVRDARPDISQSITDSSSGWHTATSIATPYLCWTVSKLYVWLEQSEGSRLVMLRHSRTLEL